MARTKKIVSTRMNDEQIARYADELRGLGRQDTGYVPTKNERFIGNQIWDAIYSSSNRFASAYRCLNGLRGRGIGDSAEFDALIDRVIAKIEGK